MLYAPEFEIKPDNTGIQLPKLQQRQTSAHSKYFTSNLSPKAKHSNLNSDLGQIRKSQTKNQSTQNKQKPLHRSPPKSPHVEVNQNKRRLDLFKRKVIELLRKKNRQNDLEMNLNSLVQITTEIDKFSPIYEVTEVPKILQNIESMGKTRSMIMKSRSSKQEDIQIVLNFGSQLLLNSQINTGLKKQIYMKPRIITPFLSECLFFQIMIDGFYLTLVSLGEFSRQNAEKYLVERTAEGRDYQSTWIIERVTEEIDAGLAKKFECIVCISNLVTNQYLQIESSNEPELCFSISKKLTIQCLFTLQKTLNQPGGQYKLIPIYYLEDKNAKQFKSAHICLLPIQISEINIYYEIFFAQKMMKQNPSLKFIHLLIDELLAYNIPQFVSGGQNNIVSEHIQQLLALTNISSLICSYLISCVQSQMYENNRNDDFSGKKNIYRRYLSEHYEINFHTIIQKDIRLLCYQNQLNSQIFYPLVTALLKECQSPNRFASSLSKLIKNNNYFISQFKRQGWYEIIIDKLIFTSSIQEYQMVGQLLTLLGTFCEGPAAIPNKYLIMHTIESLHKESVGTNQAHSLSTGNLSYNPHLISDNFPWLNMYPQGQYLFTYTKKIPSTQLKTFLETREEEKLLYYGQMALIGSLCSQFFINGINKFLPLIKGIATYCYKPNFPLFQTESRHKTLEVIIKCLDWEKARNKKEVLFNIGIIDYKSKSNKIDLTISQIMPKPEMEQKQKLPNPNYRATIKGLRESKDPQKMKIKKKSSSMKTDEMHVTKKETTKVVFTNNKKNISSHELLIEMYQSFQNKMLDLLVKLKGKNIEIYNIIFPSPHSNFIAVDINQTKKPEKQKQRGKMMEDIKNFNQDYSCLFSPELNSWLKVVELTLKSRLLRIMKTREVPYIQYLKKMFQNANIHAGPNRVKYQNSKSQSILNEENEYQTSVNIILEFVDKIIGYNPVYDYYLEQIRTRKKKSNESNFLLKSAKNKIVDGVFQLGNKLIKNSQKKSMKNKKSYEEFEKNNYIIYIFEEAQKAMINNLVSEGLSFRYSLNDSQNHPYIVDLQHLNQVKSTCFKVMTLLYQNINQSNIQQAIENLTYVIKSSNNFNSKFSLVHGLQKYPNTTEIQKLRIVESWYMADTTEFFNDVTNCLRYVYDQSQIFIRNINALFPICEEETARFHHNLHFYFSEALTFSQTAQNWFRGPVLQVYRSNHESTIGCLDNILNNIKKMTFSSYFALKDCQRIMENLRVLTICHKFFAILVSEEKKSKERCKRGQKFDENNKFMSSGIKQANRENRDSLGIIELICEKLIKILEFFCYHSLHHSKKTLLVLGQCISESTTLSPLLQYLFLSSHPTSRNPKQFLNTKNQITMQFISILGDHVITNLIYLLPHSKFFIKAILCLDDLDFIRVVHRISQSLINICENKKSESSEGQMTIIQPLLNGESQKLQGNSIELIYAMIQDKECIQLFNLITRRLHEISNCGTLYLHWYYDIFLQHLLYKEHHSNIKFKSKILQVISQKVTQLHSSTAILLHLFYWNAGRQYETTFKKKNTKTKRASSKILATESEREDRSVYNSQIEEKSSFGFGKNLQTKHGRFLTIQSHDHDSQTRNYGVWLESQPGKLFIIDYILSEALTTLSSISLLAQKNEVALRKYMEYYLFDLVPLLKLLPKTVLSENSHQITKRVTQYLASYQNLRQTKQGENSKKNQSTPKKKMKLSEFVLRSTPQKKNAEGEHHGLIQLSEYEKKVLKFLETGIMSQEIQPRYHYLSHKIQDLKSEYYQEETAIHYASIYPKNEISVDKQSKKALKKWYKARLHLNSEHRIIEQQNNRMKFIEDIQKLQLQYQNSQSKDSQSMIEKVINSEDLIHKLLTTCMNLHRIKLDPENQIFILKQMINWLLIQRQKYRQQYPSEWIDNRRSKPHKQKSIIQYFFGRKEKLNTNIISMGNHRNRNEEEYPSMIKFCTVDSFLEEILYELSLKARDKNISHIIHFCYLLQITFLTCQIYQLEAPEYLQNKQFIHLIRISEYLRKHYFVFHEIIYQYLLSSSIELWVPITKSQKQEAQKWNRSKYEIEIASYVWSPLLTLLRIFKKIINLGMLIVEGDDDSEDEKKEVYDEKYEILAKQIMKIQFDLLSFLPKNIRFENLESQYSDGFSGNNPNLSNPNLLHDLSRIKSYLQNSIIPAMIEIGGQGYDRIHEQFLKSQEYYKVVDELWRR